MDIRPAWNQTGQEGTALTFSGAPLSVDKGIMPFFESYREQRNPLLLFLLEGLFLLRLDTRRLFGLLFQEPPRWGFLPAIIRQTVLPGLLL